MRVENSNFLDLEGKDELEKRMKERWQRAR